MEPAQQVDCLIVGAGPAGLTAGLYLRRFLRSVCVVDGGKARALWIPRSHNVPGFVDGIPGHELMAAMYRQFAAVGGEVVTAEVHTLERSDDGFTAAYRDGCRVHARKVLLATGSRDEVPDWPATDLLRRQGLLRQCPVCDGFEHSGQRIGVYGPGRGGAREALFLSHFSKDVTWLSGDDDAPPEAKLADRLQSAGVKRLIGRVADAEPLSHAARGGSGRGVRVRLHDGTRHRFDVLYAALGCQPHASLGATLGAALDDGGNLVVDAKCRTTVQGLYAAGDVTGGLDQIVVAMGQAAIAATGIHNNLR